MKIGVVGAGQFSSSFIPLFQAHPYVSEVYLAELIPDRLDRVAKKLWDNRFSNESALMRTSDGGCCRINEFRRVGWISKIDSVYMSLFGSKGSYEQHANGSVWTSLQSHEITDLTAKLSCRPSAKSFKKDISSDLSKDLVDDFYSGMCEIHSAYRLPEEFHGLHNGHSGSHQFLADDFVKAVHFGKLPPNHVGAAARYAAPGVVAHESAEKDGILLDVPDFGEPPANLTMLEPDIVNIT